MSGLSEQDREEIHDEADRFYDAGETGLSRDTYWPDLLASVEAIVARRVREALTEAAEWIEACEVIGNDLLDTELGRNVGYQDAARIVRDLTTDPCGQTP